MRNRATAVNLIVGLLLAGAFATTGFAQETSKKIDLGMFMDMVAVSNPRISPDGHHIVYTRRWVDKMTDHYVTSIWIMNADGTQQRFLAKGSDPKWSPDSSRIAYVASAPSRGKQIFVRWLNASSGSPITNLNESPSDLSWSPDGHEIAFTSLVLAHRDNFEIHLTGKPEDAKWTASPRIIQRLHYQENGVGFLPDGYRHIFVVSSDGGAARQLTAGNWNDGGASFFGGGLSWTRDGSEILFSGLRADDFAYHPKESYIYAVKVATGEVQQLDHDRASHRSPIVSPNGKYIVYSGAPIVHEAYTTSHLYVMNVDGSDPREITGKVDNSPRGVTWAPDSSGVYFNVGSEGTSNLYFATLAGKVHEVTGGTHMLSVSSISKSGVAAATVASYYKPADVYTFRLSEPEQLTQLTSVNSDLFHGIKLGKVEEFSYPSFDGLKIQGWIVRPPDFQEGKKYPMILNIHGGPAGMYNVGFDFGRQVDAAHGYVVVYINPRGSTGYGSAFANGINFDYPGPDYKDLMKGVDYVISRGHVDPNNLFVYGCSGGGVLTSWTVGHTDRFAAAAVECPVTDWLSFAGITDSINYYSLFFHKLPWQDPSEFLKHSSLMYVDHVKTPTLMIVGVLDRRTPMSQTEEFYEALKLLKVPTAMILLNDQYHGTDTRPSNFMRAELYVLHWFQKYKGK